MEDKIDIQSLELIFNRMVKSIDQSKTDIFVISEQSRNSYEEMKRELEEVRARISQIILETEIVEDRFRLARQRLAEVSKHFSHFSEEQVRLAYEKANNLQIQLSVSQTEEKQLRKKRDDLERRLQSLLDTIERADQIVNQVNVVLNYLTNDLKNVKPALENAKEKQDFSLRIIQAQEDERKRVSREIHDGAAQMLANVLLRTDLIERTYREKGVDRAIEEISQLKVMVRNALHEVRRIIYDLRPMALDDLGIVPTLKKYLSSVEEYNKGHKIHFSSTGSERRIPTNFETSIFRMIQESISNAIKHGKSPDVWVRLEWLKDRINIIVKDNGTGFDPQAAKKDSFGLIGMKERVEILKGEMQIQSTINNGTTILFKIPLIEEYVE